MQKITVRRIVLGGILLCMSLMALLTLCFNILSLVGGAEVDLLKNFYKVRTDDNGFVFMSGNSVFLSELSAFSTEEHYIAGIESLILVSEILCICFIVIAVASVIFTFLWFFIGKTYGFARAAIASSIFVVAAYFVLGIGIRVNAIEGFTFEVYGANGGDGVFGDYFDHIAMNTLTTYTRPEIRKIVSNGLQTFAYVPLIIVGTLTIVYAICFFIIKDKQQVFDNGAEENVNGQADGDKKQLFIYGTVDVNCLRELKQLFDEGILTEEEFMEQKRLALGKKE